MLTKIQKDKLKDAIHCSNPVYLFDDDPDGLASFILLYEIIKEGRGICVKTSPLMTASFARRALETDPGSLVGLGLRLPEGPCCRTASTLAANPRHRSRTGTG